MNLLIFYKLLKKDLYLEFDDSGQLSTKIYDKRDDFNFKITKFQTCAAIYQLLLHMVFTSRNWFAMQGPVAIILSLSLYIFTIWKCIAYNRFCRDGIYFDKILVSEYKLFKRSNKANLNFLFLIPFLRQCLLYRQKDNILALFFRQHLICVETKI
jgi:hypothetical protein